MKTITKFASVLAISALLIGGTAACSTNEPTPASTSAPAPEAAELTTAKAAESIKTFVTAATDEKVAAAFPDKGNKDTFAGALAHIDPKASAEKTSKVLADFAMVKYSAPKAKVTVDVDVSKVKVTDLAATVPAAAVVVKSDGKKVATSDALAAQVNNLVFSEGAWMISFPEAKADVKPSAKETTPATPNPSASAAAVKK